MAEIVWKIIRLFKIICNNDSYTHFYKKKKYNGFQASKYSHFSTFLKTYIYAMQGLNLEVELLSWSMLTAWKFLVHFHFLMNMITINTTVE